MSENVKRYDEAEAWDPYGYVVKSVMQEDSEGEYVRYMDYSSLRKELEDSQEELAWEMNARMEAEKQLPEGFWFTAWRTADSDRTSLRKELEKAKGGDAGDGTGGCADAVVDKEKKLVGSERSFWRM